jgi:hypothetical protein
MDNDINEEIIKTKGKMYAITTLSIIGIIILFFVIGLYFIKSFSNDFFKYKENYYSLDITNNNKEQIISFLKAKEIDYCESLYKIEYVYSFPHQEKITIYCKNEQNVNLYTDNNSELVEYIKYTGKFGER